MEYSLFYRAFLQKRPVILRRLLVVATPSIQLVEKVDSIYRYGVATTSRLLKIIGLFRRRTL